MNIILDTNVLIAGILHCGSEERILNLVKSKELQIVYSKEILIEYILAPTNLVLKLNNTLKQKQIKTLSYQLATTISTFIDYSIKVEVTSNGHYLDADSSDDKFINLAIDANVKYIVSEDEDLYSDIDIKNKKGESIVVISPYQFEKTYKLHKKYGT